MKNSRLLTILLAIAAALVLLTGAIALPILCRPFYYAHIGPLHLTEQTGLTEEEIRTAYDEMLDFCLGAPEFSTGALSWSQSGRDHFADVRVLFLLDLAVLAIGVACGAGGVGLIATAFIGLPMVADMLILLGGGAAVIAIALVVIWLAIWLFIRMVIGWVRLLVRLGKRWCRKEIAA